MFTNPDKVLYPAVGFTKADLVGYYVAVAPYILPHLENRPVTLKRYPDGIRGKSFWEKDAPAYRPRWVRTAPVPRVILRATLDRLGLRSFVKVSGSKGLQVYVPLKYPRSPTPPPARSRTRSRGSWNGSIPVFPTRVGNTFPCEMFCRLSRPPPVGIMTSRE